ncbi:FtsX-like permease family protein [Clostridium perfringens]|nr:FtsX-like permease family protein [Clostridium perfringens]
MKLSSLIVKNIKHNIKNYVAYLLGNSFILTILFMFFSLIFSKSFMNEPSTSLIKENLTSVIALMLAFSVVFIIYTTITFTKYRGKEFGVYYTIGLTSKNIIKILSCENAIVALISFIVGALGGSIFVQLFYKAIEKILNLKNIDFGLSIKSYLGIAAITIFIYLFNTLYQMRFLRKLSIVQILKSSAKKDIGKASYIMGILGIIALIASMILYRNTLSDISSDAAPRMIICIILAIVSLYFIIGFAMTVIAKISKRFKRFYNKNIVPINSLSHRFISYRGVLYVVTLLVAGAMVCISMTYSMYKATEKYINGDYPFDIGIIVDRNSINKYDFKDIIEKAGADIKNYHVVESISVPNLMEKDGQINFDAPQMIISESSYNELYNKNVNIKEGEALYWCREQSREFADTNMIIDIPTKEDKDYNILNNFKNGRMPLSEYKKEKDNKNYTVISKDNRVNNIGSVTNYVMNDKYLRGSFLVINDEDYKKLKEAINKDNITYDVQVNINNNKDFASINDKLQKELNLIGDKDIPNSLTVKAKRFNEEIDSRGFSLFTYAFLGMMMLVGSGAVLYFKTFTSLEDDKARGRQLVKLGLTKKEVSKIITKELTAIFIVPPVIALLIIGYYLSKLYVMIPDGDYMWQNSIEIFIIYGIIQIIFFFLTKIKYIREVRSNI